MSFRSASKIWANLPFIASSCICISSSAGVNGLFSFSFSSFNCFNKSAFSLVALSLASFKLSCVVFNSPASRWASFLSLCFLNVFLARFWLNVAISAFRSSSNFSLFSAVAFKVAVVLRNFSANISFSLLIISQLVICYFLKCFCAIFSAKKKKNAYN